MSNAFRRALARDGLSLLICAASAGLCPRGLRSQTPVVTGDSFSLRISGRLQFRAVAFRDLGDGPADNELDFEFERARILFSGSVLDPKLTFMAQLDGDNADRTFINFKDLYIQYSMLDRLALRVGKWVVPNGMQETTSAFRQHMVDRSIANEFFNIDRGIGLGLRGDGDTWSAEVALFNGFDVEDASANRRRALDANPAAAVRLSVDLWGPFGDGESDLDGHVRPVARVAVSSAYSRIDSVGGDELRPPTLRVVSSGTPIADVVPGAPQGFSVWLMTIATGFKLAGLGVGSEYFSRRVFDFGGSTLDAVIAHGLYAQAGYFVVPRELEVAGRWSRVWGDEFPGRPGESSREVGGALNYFIRGQDLKLTLGVSHLDGAPLTSEDGEFRAGDHGVLAVTQLQLLF